MRNLYFKIFIWFWLAMALVGAAFVISTMMTQTGEADSRWRPLVESGLRYSGQSAIDVYEANGQTGLVAFFERLERRSDLRAYLFDAEAHELSGRVPPAAAAALVARAATTDELQIEMLDDGRLVARRIAAPDGGTFVMVAEMRQPFRGGRALFDGRRGRGRGDRPEGFEVNRRSEWPAVWLSFVDEPGELLLRLLAVFLTAGIVCFALARYLTAPVLRLRNATHELAAGDLSVRVGPTVGNRRDELAELGRDFDVMAERIEGLLTTQRQLLSDVSHELRSPLARLNVALALARQRSGADAAGPLDRIEEEAEQLNNLIGQVLALSRLESGAGKPERTPVDLAGLISDVAADAEFEAHAKGCSVQVMETGAALVDGDQQLLRSAVDNVVRNAVRYTAAGTDVEIGVSTVGDEVVVAVRDHGPGVAEDQLGELFQPFYRIADSRDRETGGTGLGLAITERAVRSHGGSVSARNHSEGGLVVELRLKRRP